MKIISDWHIHSQNSCDGACMTISDLINEAAINGIRYFGITDHLHTPYNLPDIAKSRAEFLSGSPSPNFHFRIEVSCVSLWEIEEITRGHYNDPPIYGLRSGCPPGCNLAIGITEEDIRTYQIEYVVGGTHWPMYVPMERQAVIRDYHRQNMFLATHPLVDIVAHPWWWMGYWQDNNGNYPAGPWFDNFALIPHSMHEEFAAALTESGTKAEINISAILLNPHYPNRFISAYLEYLSELQERGVCLSIGSDCHSAHYNINFEKVARMLESAGIVDNFWHLEQRSN